MASLEKIQQRLQLLEDKQELAELLDQYCKTPDRADFKGHADCYTDDGIQQYGPWGSINGRKNIEKTITENEKEVQEQLHYMTNMRFEVNGNQATGTSYLLMVVLDDKDQPTEHVWQGGPYNWSFEKTSQGWRIKTMKLRATWVNKKDPKGRFTTEVKE